MEAYLGGSNGNEDISPTLSGPTALSNMSSTYGDAETCLGGHALSASAQDNAVGDDNFLFASASGSV